MKLNIQAVEMELTTAIKMYVEKKFGLLHKLIAKQENKDAVMGTVELGKTTKHHHSGDLFKAEIHIKIGKDSYNATATKDDLYAAIDAIKDELEREIISKKDRRITLKTRGARKIKKILKGLKKP